LLKGGGAAAAPSAAVDKVRASRDGHEYHEAWAVRTALELLVPTTTLTAISLEGFSFEDSAHLSSDAVEIADLIRYRGGMNLHTAQAVETVQFKYSIARADVPIRAPDIRKTLTKFANAERDAHQVLGPERAMATVSYELATNRPFDGKLASAITGLRNGLPLAGDAGNAGRSDPRRRSPSGRDSAIVHAAPHADRRWRRARHCQVRSPSGSRRLGWGK
jgi:hypothetical protein